VSEIKSVDLGMWDRGEKRIAELEAKLSALTTRLAEMERERDEARTWAAALKDQAAVVGDTIPRLAKSVESAEQLLSEMAEGLRRVMGPCLAYEKCENPLCALLAKYDARKGGVVAVIPEGADAR
jgi:predicted  nucleic acid-binding Zn-ribbon protein